MPEAQESKQVQQAKRVVDDAHARSAMWTDLLGTKGWLELKKHLEEQYAAAMTTDADTFEQFKEKQGSIRTIRGIFELIGHDFSREDLAKVELYNKIHAETRDITTPYNPYGADYGSR